MLLEARSNAKTEVCIIKALDMLYQKNENESENDVFISLNSLLALIPLRDLFAAKWTRSREHAVTTKFALDSRA